MVDFPLPSYSEIQEELKRLMDSIKQEISTKDISSLTLACQGLSLERIRRVLSKIIAQYGKIDKFSASLILEEKTNNTTNPNFGFLYSG